MHAKTDSDVSSPPRRSGSGSGPVYYVQSPSRDSSTHSHDGDKNNNNNNNSFHSTPVMTSPMGSPPHSTSSLGPHSRESSSTRFSGSGRPRTGKGGRNQRGKAENHHPFDAIEEESLIGGGGGGREGGVSRRCWYVMGFVLAFFLLFAFFSLVLWGASRNQKPLIAIKSIKFAEFEIQAGLDTHGVPTAMASTNATVKMAYRNTGTFFGVHVTSSPFQLLFMDLSLASGLMDYFYENRKSTRHVDVEVSGSSVPLYGAAYNMNVNQQGPTGPIPLTLLLKVRSRAYVLGHLVKPKFYKSINCTLFMDPTKINKPMSLKNNCTYT